jgi:hypothetical protein
MNKITKRLSSTKIRENLSQGKLALAKTPGASMTTLLVVERVLIRSCTPKKSTITPRLADLTLKLPNCRSVGTGVLIPVSTSQIPYPINAIADRPARDMIAVATTERCLTGWLPEGSSRFEAPCSDSIVTSQCAFGSVAPLDTMELQGCKVEVPRVAERESVSRPPTIHLGKVTKVLGVSMPGDYPFWHKEGRP